jgi:hypothetical protein
MSMGESQVHHLIPVGKAGLGFRRIPDHQTSNERNLSKMFEIPFLGDFAPGKAGGEASEATPLDPCEILIFAGE